jgi:hypothetical protein
MDPKLLPITDKNNHQWLLNVNNIDTVSSAISDDGEKQLEFLTINTIGRITIVVQMSLEKFQQIIGKMK